MERESNDERPLLSPSWNGRRTVTAGNGTLQSIFGGAATRRSNEAGGPTIDVGEPGLSIDYAETIDDVTLPEPVTAIADDYAEVFGERDRFLWRWIYSLLPEFTLSSVADEHAETVRVRKTILTVFVTLLDDLAEKRGDVRTFDAIHRLVCWEDAGQADRSGVDAEVFSLAERIWAAFEAPLEDAPRYDQYRDVLTYDLRQALNAMDYSRLINERLSMANLAGLGHYGPHNMVMFPYADLDLVYSPGFDRAEFGAVRELVWDLQKMARIGNWLSTWERELREGDYTAGIIVYALQQGVVSIEDVESADPERRAAAAERIRDHGIEELFLEEWRRLHSSVADHGLEAESVDLDDFVSGMETVMAHHMASRGHK